MSLSKLNTVAVMLRAVALLATGATALLTQAAASDPTGAQSSTAAAGEQGKLRKVAECRQDLERIGLALFQYHDENLCLPSASPYPGLSWRVAVLPFLGQKDLYKQFKLDEPWDSPNNKKLLASMPDVYRNPRFQKRDAEPTQTYFRGFTGQGTVLGLEGGLSLALAKGLPVERTLLVAEAGEAVAWTKPDELPYDPKKPLPRLGGPDGGDFFLGLFCDGHVQRVPIKTDQQKKVVRWMIQVTNTNPFDLPKDRE